MAGASGTHSHTSIDDKSASVSGLYGPTRPPVAGQSGIRKSVSGPIGSGTVILKRDASGGFSSIGGRFASGPRNAISSVSDSSVHWRCTVCGIQLPKESVTTGGSELIEGKLFCARCLKKRRSAPKSSKSIYVSAAVGVVAVGATLAVLAPRIALFGALPLGALLIFGGLLGSTFMRVTRLALITSGLAVLVIFALGVSTVSQHTHVQEASREALEQLKDIDSKLEKGDYVAAREAFDALSLRMEDQRPAEAVRVRMEDLRGRLAKKRQDLFGNASDEEQGLLLALLRIFPQQESLKQPRFHIESLNGRALKLKAVTTAGAQRQANGPVAAADFSAPWLAETRRLVEFLFESYPSLAELELNVDAAAEGNDPVRVATFALSRDSFIQMKNGGMLIQFAKGKIHSAYLPPSASSVPMPVATPEKGPLAPHEGVSNR